MNHFKSQIFILSKDYGNYDHICIHCTGHQERQAENDYQIMNEEGGEDPGDEHEYHVLEGPGRDTHVNQNRGLEMREVKESGEEHAYHVLEGPGGSNTSKQPGVREVGGARNYEIPLYH